MTFSFNAFIVSRGLFGLLLEVRKTRQKAKYAKKETWPVCKYAVRKKSLGQFLGNLLSTGFSTVTNKCHPSPLELPPPPSSLLQSTAWVWSAVQGSGIGILGHSLDVSVLLSFPICLFSYVFFPWELPTALPVSCCPERCVSLWIDKLSVTYFIKYSLRVALCLREFADIHTDPS